MINPFRTPSAEMLAARELEEAKRHLLMSQKSRDYYQKMVEFYNVRIDALTQQLQVDEPATD